MVQFAPTIDVSALPAPEAIKGLDYEAIVAARKASIVARFEDAGIFYDVEDLETDPAMILQQEDAYRELLDKGAINDAVRAVLPAFATKNNLENIAARANVARAEGDTDAVLLKKYLNSFARPACGSAQGFIYDTLVAWPQAHDIRPLGPAFHKRRGRSEIVLLAPGGVTTPRDIVSTVRTALLAEDVAPLTDDVVVRAAVVRSWSIEARLFIPRGPDPQLIKEQAALAATAWAARRYFIGGRVDASLIPGLLAVPNVVRVEMKAPMVDVPTAADAAPWLASIKLTHEVET